MYRDDSTGYQPVIIKASQAGALETLMQEAEKIIGNQFRIQVVGTSVGPLTDKELKEAQNIGAIIFGFDISVPPSLEGRIEGAGVSVHLHKLIYTF